MKSIFCIVYIREINWKYTGRYCKSERKVRTPLGFSEGNHFGNNVKTIRTIVNCKSELVLQIYCTLLDFSCRLSVVIFSCLLFIFYVKQFLYFFIGRMGHLYDLFNNFFLVPPASAFSYTLQFNN